MNPDLFLLHMEAIRQLEAKGHRSFFVGGCVRDALLGLTASDVDIATTATPDEVRSIFPGSVDIGATFGTVMVICGGNRYQVTTFRTESGYTNNRRPDRVEFTLSLEQDLARRDFSINAMAYCPGEGLVDLYGGKQDLQDRRIRAVGNPGSRFREDALRILRAIRFSCVLDFDIEEQTLEGMKEHGSLLHCIAVERILQELRGCILSPHPQRMELLRDLEYFLDFRHVDLSELSKEPDCILRAAQLLQNCHYRDVLRQFKVDKATAGRIIRILDHRELPNRLTGYILRKLASNFGFADARRVLLLHGKDPSGLERIRERGDCVSLSELRITGDDLIREGVASEGEKVGRILEVLLDEVLRHPGHNQYPLLLKASRRIQF